MTNKKTRAIATLCIGAEAEKYGIFSHPAMNQYAREVDADFIVISKRKINLTGVHNFNPILFEKYQLYEILENYDRVLYVDTDVLITPNAPNIFEIVAKNNIGGVFEDFGTEKEDRRKIMKCVQEKLGDVGWRKGYMNSGVFLVSKMHRKIFRMYEKYGIYDGEYEQTNTNWYIRKAGFNIQEIDYKFNFMGLMRIFYGPFHRNAYFIHYAGKGGLFPWIPKLQQLENDFEYFYKNGGNPSFEEL